MSSEKLDLDIIFGPNTAISWINPFCNSRVNSTQFTPTNQKSTP